MLARNALAREDLVAGTSADRDEGPVILDPPFGHEVDRDRNATIPGPPAAPRSVYRQIGDCPEEGKLVGVYRAVVPEDRFDRLQRVESCRKGSGVDLGMPEGPGFFVVIIDLCGQSETQPLEEKAVFSRVSEDIASAIGVHSVGDRWVVRRNPDEEKSARCQKRAESVQGIQEQGIVEMMENVYASDRCKGSANRLETRQGITLEYSLGDRVLPTGLGEHLL